MHELATIPFARSLPKDWSGLGHGTLRIAEHALAGAVVIKLGRRVEAPLSWSSDDQLLWLQQGPREWLATSGSLDSAAIIDRVAPVVADATVARADATVTRADATVTRPGATVAVLDVTDRVLQLDFAGGAAAQLFSKGTSLDPVLLPAGHCRRTRFANLSATVLRSTNSDEFSVLVDRTYAAYLHAWLKRAAQDLAPI